jgi:GTP:adenosylcobinamide-phosphate guanylyltransferase
MLLRVVRTLRGSPAVHRIVVCGIDAAALHDQPELSEWTASGELEFTASGDTPSASVLQVLESDGAATPLLVTTADHPLLTAPIVDSFCAQATRLSVDVAVGLVAAEVVAGTFTEGRRTRLRFRDGSYCGCNLYAFLTPDAQRAARAWRRIEQHRKQPWRMIGALGPWVLLRFLLGRLGLDEAIEIASSRIGARAAAIQLTQPEAGFDVDKLSDLRIAEAYLKEKESGRTP